MLANDTTRSKTDAEEAPDAGGDLEGVETPAAGGLVDSEPPPINPPAEGE